MDEEPREGETMQAALGKEVLTDPAEELRERFAFYLDEFDLRPETRKDAG